MVFDTADYLPPLCQLVRQIQYLQIENKILCSRLPRRIHLTPGERARLLRSP